ncbi:MAG: DUF2334 domain-containing protein [Sandaracinaceae bacterium]
MKYVTLRDDDANATTEAACVEHLYGDLLGRGVPMALALIPEVRTDTRTAEGDLELYLRGARAGEPGTIPIADNAALVELAARFEVLQHGLTHERTDDHYELETTEPVGDRLDRGRRLLEEAGLFAQAFAAPQDAYRRPSFRAVQARYDTIVCGFYGWRWFDPWHWAAVRQAPRRPRRIGQATLLTHRGEPDLRDPDAVVASLPEDEPTGLVVHHWSFFDEAGRPDAARVAALRLLLARLVEGDDVRVISHREAAQRVRAGGR